MLKWKCSDVETMGDCEEHTQNIDYLIKCPMVSQ